MNRDTGLDPSTHYQYAPWTCPTCGGDSDEPQICTECGKLLEGQKSTAGREDNT